MTYRILVTGARSWPKSHEDFVWFKVFERAMMKALDGETDIVVVHGQCPDGVDKYVADWLERNNQEATGQGITAEPHPADWKKYGWSAGPIRNHEMVDLGADVCFAFLMPCSSARCKRTDEHESHGTTDCADYAERSGIPTTRFGLANFVATIRA